MKTIKEAYEELKGDLNNTFGAENLTLDCVYLFHSTSIDGEYIVDNSKSEDGGAWQYICSIEEFNNYKGDDKPVYTQAMCDAGELPSVGMECTHVNLANESWFCAIDYISKEVVVLSLFNGKTEKLGYVTQKAIYLNDVSKPVFKPLTPPIELIDGERYHFVHKQYGGSLGFYNSADEKFYNWDQWVVAAHCTNIKPLTVEGECNE